MNTMALSQESNKKRGTCSVCLDVQLHNKDGTIREHGPSDKPCAGSHKPPRHAPDISHSQSSIRGFDLDLSTHQSSTNLSKPPTQTLSFDQPNLKCGTIRHIPKSARAGCAVYLMSVLKRIPKNTDDLEAWSSLMSMGKDILLVPKHTGKKHSLASIITRRVDGVWINASTCTGL